MSFYEILKAMIFGIVEGVTEWLPISSTGHMIILGELVSLQLSEDFFELFLVLIQLGAILAVPTCLGKQLFVMKNGGWRLYLKIAVGCIPAAVLGLLFDDLLDEYFYNYLVVAASLLVYGVAFVVLDRAAVAKKYRIGSISDITTKDALLIGVFQSLSLIPGTSRSGSTILGGLFIGASRAVSAEFSFLMAIPIMLGASGLKIVKFAALGRAITRVEMLILLIGFLTAFLVSILVIKLLLRFLKEHTLFVFGVYRIALSAVILTYFFLTKM